MPRLRHSKIRNIHSGTTQGCFKLLFPDQLQFLLKKSCYLLHILKKREIRLCLLYLYLLQSLKLLHLELLQLFTDISFNLSDNFRIILVYLSKLMLFQQVNHLLKHHLLNSLTIYSSLSFSKTSVLNCLRFFRQMFCTMLQNDSESFYYRGYRGKYSLLQMSLDCLPESQVQLFDLLQLLRN